MGYRVYRKDHQYTPSVAEIEIHKERIEALLKDGYSVTAIMRKMNWGNDLTLRSWLKNHEVLDNIRKQNGTTAQHFGNPAIERIIR